jgi:hypothetical protein
MALTTKTLSRTGLARRLELEDERDQQERLVALPRPAPIPCVKCGGEVEESPMKENTCYDCYRESFAIVADDLPAENDLGTHIIISGGEVFEIDATVPTSPDDEIPF